MTTRFQVQPLVQITDPDFQAGFEEAQELYYADCRIRTDTGLVEVVRGMLTEYAVEMGLSEQQLRRSTGFIIGILSRSQFTVSDTWAFCPGIFLSQEPFTMKKICPGCGQERDAEKDFRWRYKDRGIRQARCRYCQAESNKTHYQNNKQAYLDRAKSRNDRIIEENQRRL